MLFLSISPCKPLMLWNFNAFNALESENQTLEASLSCHAKEAFKCNHKLADSIKEVEGMAQSN